MSFLKKLRVVIVDPYYSIDVKGKRVKELGQALLIYFGLMLLYIMILKYLDQWFGLPPHKALQFFTERGWQTVVIMGMIIVPFIEELTFRLSLKFTPLNLSIALSLLFFFILSIMTKSSFYKLDRAFVLKLFFISVFFCITYLVFRRNGVALTLNRIWVKYHIYIILGSAFIFAFLHIRNIGSLSIKNILFMPIIAFPQLLLAILTSYFRLVYGIFWSIIFHVIINAGPILFILLIKG